MTISAERLDTAEANEIAVEGCWPLEFITYYRVLKSGRTLGQTSKMPADWSAIHDINCGHPGTMRLSV